MSRRSLDYWLVDPPRRHNMFDPIEIAQLGPEVVRIVAMVIRAKKAKSPGGQKLTEEEKDLIRDALEELLLEAAEDARD